MALLRRGNTYSLSEIEQGSVVDYNGNKYAVIKSTYYNNGNVYIIEEGISILLDFEKSSHKIVTDMTLATFLYSLFSDEE